MSSTILEREPRSDVMVAFKDCDAFGLLYNTRYLDYIMDARAEHLIKHYDLDFHRDLQRTKETWVVHSHQIVFVEPARVHEQITIRTRMLSFNSNTCLLEGIMMTRDGTRLKALQWTKLSYVNLARGTAQNHPESVVAFLQQIRAQDDVPEPLEFEARANELRGRFRALKKEN